MAQYSFVFWNSTGADRAQRRFLFPLGDLANHKCGLLFLCLSLTCSSLRNHLNQENDSLLTA